MEESKDFEWQSLRRRLSSNSVPFENNLNRRAHFHLSSDELQTLCSVTSLKPGTRGYSEIRSLLHVLRGSDTLLQLNEDHAATLAGGVRIEEYTKGDVIATETNADEGFVMVIQGCVANG